MEDLLTSLNTTSIASDISNTTTNTVSSVKNIDTITNSTTSTTTTTTPTIINSENDKDILIPALLSSELISNSKNSMIKQSKEKGRYVVAKQDIKSGESIVFREEPYVVCMNYKDPYERKICHHCFGLSSTTSKSMTTTPDFTLHCDTCNIVWYCSNHCQLNDLIYHKHECFTYKRMQSSSQFDTSCKTSIKLLLKLIIKQYLEIKDQSLSLNPSSSIESKEVRFKDILTLETNLNKFSTQRITEFRMISKFIEKTMDKEFLKVICPTNKEVIEFQNNLIKLMCILECNSHDISFTIPQSTKSSYEYFSIGIGLYYHSSMFNHSCTPNICKVIESKQHPQPISTEKVQYSGNFATHSMIAIKDIKKDEEISFNYIQVTLSKVDRLKKLESSYHFQCKCPSCIGDVNNKASIKSHSQFIEKHICKSKTGNCSGILFPLNDNLICNICRPIILK
ncbi:hypothetical protein RB653_009233 [Dictyostelium firmibasis]|uniref:SET domain-containing protein n=1 Tax=Dictyostelium firmibasis TaxID=79012 RepID=A0AAN7TTR5_9MYCE